MAASQSEVLEFSIPLPRSLDTRIYIRLSTKAKAIVLFLTTASQDDASTATPLGSLVYALPNRLDNSQPLSTTMYSVEATLEFTTRMAKLLARRTQLPVYVTNSISFASAGMGGTIEEEMEAFKAIVNLTLEKLQQPVGGLKQVNGDAST